MLLDLGHVHADVGLRFRRAEIDRERLQRLLAAMLQLGIEAELAAHPDRRRLAVDHHQRVALDDVLLEIEPHVLRRSLQDRDRGREVCAA